MEKMLIYNAISQQAKIEEVEEIKLEHLQQIVGGNGKKLPCHELVALKIIAFGNEDGKLRMLPPAVYLLERKDKIRDFAVGNVIFAALDENGKTKGLNPFQIRSLAKMLRKCRFYVNNV